MTAVRAALEELGLPLAEPPLLRALVTADVFSGFYWSRGAADVRGGGVGVRRMPRGGAGRRSDVWLQIRGAG